MPVEKRIISIMKRLPFDEDTGNHIRTHAIKLATKYLDALLEDEERSTLDVALGAVYLSCLEFGFKISQTQLASSVSNGLNRWPCVVVDMSKRL